MHRMSARAYTLAAALAIAAFAAIHAAPRAVSQTGPGWVSLFDGKTIGEEWDRVGETNWRIEDGAIVADKRTSQTAAHLVTKAKYKDFQIYVEFWASDDANSGIFLRCQEPTKITDRSCYEVNIFDQRKDPTYGTGGIVHFVRGEPDAQGRRQVEHLRDHRQGPADHRGAQRPEDGRSCTTACSSKGRSRCNTARA